MKVSIRRILFPTDFSEASQPAKNYACAIAGPFDAELHVLHVVSEPLAIPGPNGSWIDSKALLMSEIARDESRLVAEMKDSGIKASQIFKTVRVGDPIVEIVKYAEKLKIDLIVLGTHGRTGLSRVLIGSVAEKIVRLATCPVLTVHPQGHQFLLTDSDDKN